GQVNHQRLEDAGCRPVLGEAEDTLVEKEYANGSRSKRANFFTTTERATNSSDEDADRRMSFSTHSTRFGSKRRSTAAESAVNPN
ncbi:hypothetical protein JG687_00015655, partial [Phytophthora cactorum]